MESGCLLASEIPPLPEGFTLDSAPPAGIPPLPEGFTLDSAPKQRSTAQEVGRQGALAGRAIVEGLGDLAAIPANALAGLGNLMLELDRRISGNKDRAVIGDQSRGATEALNALGVAAPETDTERMVNTIGRRATVAAATVGAGGAVGGPIGTTLAANPAIQATAAATGPLAGEMARRSGAGPAGQAAADLAGSVAPGAIAAGAQMTTRGAFRGGEQGRQQVQENLDTFARAGTTPSVGQATEGRVARGAESLLARTPGGAGPMARRAEGQADEVAASIERRAAQLVPRTSAEQAGRQIERGIRGQGGFIERFRQQQGQLYGELDRHIPPDQLVGVANTQRTLQDLTRIIPGAQATSERLINPRIAAIADDLAADATNGNVPYQALRELRTRIGQEMDNGLVSDVPAAQWRRIYGALSEDLRTAANTAGPQAQAAWTRANNFTRAGMQRIESIESVLNRNGGPEAVFKAATSGTKEGATTLRSVMQSLDDEGRRTVSATVLRRLGLAKAGVQGEMGDTFSNETFLTNWNLLSPEAKRTLFDRYGPRFRGDMDAVARYAANLREGSAVFKNPSGTGQATAQAATIGGLAASVATGQVGAASAIISGVLGANLTARLMTNPRFVRWLAQTTRIPAGTSAAALNSLAQSAKDTGDKDLALAVATLEQQRADEKQKSNRKQ